MVVPTCITSIMTFKLGETPDSDTEGLKGDHPLKFNGRREGEGVHMYLKQLRLVFLLPLAKSK